MKMKDSDFVKKLHRTAESKKAMGSTIVTKSSSRRIRNKFLFPNDMKYMKQEKREVILIIFLVSYAPVLPIKLKG